MAFGAMMLAACAEAGSGSDDGHDGDDGPDGGQGPGFADAGPIPGGDAGDDVTPNPDATPPPSPDATPASSPDAMPPPIPTMHNCDTGSGYELSVHETGSTTDPELSVIAVYEPHTPSPTFTVHVTRPGNRVLMLSSYERADWYVTAGPGVTLDNVIVNGYEAQTVSAPAGVPTEVYSLEATGTWFDCGYAWPMSTGGCDEPELVAAAVAMAGVPLTSFHGCYRMSEFVLE